MKIERIETYNEQEVKIAIKQWGKSARMFQKSLSDGRGSLFNIIKQDEKIVDITEEFDPIF